jgi:anaerobic ribonucleoside-triphosphate reductase activating protein
VGALNYFKIDKCSISNGDGIRTVLWLSGCSHDCEGCHNPETHDVSNGKFFDDNAKEELFNILSKPYVDGITFSGGDPLYFLNIREVFKLSSEIREKFPNKTQWLYTGYTWEQIIEMSYENSLIEELINSLDVIVDGRFVKKLRDVSLQFRGSSNQRIIDVRKSLNMNKVVLWGENN